VGSNPTRFISFILGKNGIELSLVFGWLSDKIARNAIEDTERLVTEIEMLKVVLYLVSRSKN
jgi:hypothetical protein